MNDDYRDYAEEQYVGALLHDVNETADDDVDTDVGCPCCGDWMDPSLVVCWPCYQATDRLTPGRHMDGPGVFAITREDIARYSALRTARLAGTR